ncbi:patatin-like phospholipase family protein [Uliginosibacterium paludis]|uniref:Patatin-like phospholipase family protein n=1 Tax=Uliginosibacterium paludis TaxID=1615952 RepID=A0ABV2CMB3_9RHOO
MPIRPLRALRRIALPALLCLCGVAASAASAGTPPPRIGLVLGGGGARGLAHLGVLEELEKLHIPISCIAGTSAGALVGGIYATGQPLDGVIDRIANADWQRLLSGTADRRNLPFAAKNGDDRNLSAITLGLDGSGVHVPRRILGSQNVDRFLRELTRDSMPGSFDRLPIPFRAVATDLISGDIHVFDRGDLATALRASMAVPGVFDLVELEGHYYIDGMFVRNLPVEEIKGRCADIVIAVDVGSPTLEAGQIHSLIDVLAQSMHIAMGRNVIEQRKLLGAQDILIQPDLDGYTPASFAEAPAIIARGRKLAPATLERLRALSLDTEAWERWRSALTAAAGEPAPYARVEIAQTRYVPADEVRARIETPQAPQTQRELLERLDTLHASGDFDRINYFLHDEDGQRVATIVPLERSIGPNHLRFGTQISLDSYSKSEVTLLGSYQMTWLNRWGAQWRNDFQLGVGSRIASEFYQPLAGTPWFIAPGITLARIDKPIYASNGLHVADLRSYSTENGADLGYALGRYGELRTGLFTRRTGSRIASGLAAGVSEEVHDSGLRAALVIDQLDNPRFPRQGYHLSTRYRFGDVKSDTAGTSSRQHNASLSLDLADTFGATTLRGTLQSVRTHGASVVDAPQLGGFLQLSGLQTGELFGEGSLFGRLMVYNRIRPLLPSLGSGTYLGGSFELGRVYRQLTTGTDTPLIPAASLWIGMDTFMGPLYLGTGWSNYHGANLGAYLYLGYTP